MKIINKLYLGLGILAFLVLLLWLSSLMFINNLANTSTGIIRNNSRGIVYTEKMLQTMKELYLLQTSALNNDEPASAPSALQKDSLKSLLLGQLAKELQNITEPDERELAGRLQKAIHVYLNQFEQLDQTGFEPELYDAITQQYALVQHLLGEITFVNIERMYRKNEFTRKAASNITLYITIIGAVSCLLAIGLLVRYPNYIVHPINEFITRINKIADQNYDQRLEFETGDEFEELAEAFNAMAARLQQYETSNLAKLRNEKQRVEAIVNHMNDAVLGLDKDKNILFINTKAEELIGLKHENIAGRYAPDIATDNDLMRELIRDLMNKTVQPDRQDEKSGLLEVVSGNQKIYYSKETIPIMYTGDESKSRKQIGSIIILKNATLFHEMDEAKTNFIAVVSHELKTPISSINLSLRLLKDERVGQLNDEQKSLVKSIEDDAGRMKRSTEDLLDLSKVETGNIYLNMQRADPLELIRQANETMKLQAQQKNIHIEVESPDRLPKVKTDIQKTVWVLVNLLSNAIRYTPPKGNIKMKAEKAGRTVKFIVTDTGRGIPPEYQKKIFDKYFRVYGDQEGQEGSGLGLAISREFLRAQGGEIGVESETGKGSCFYFELPVDPEG